MFSRWCKDDFREFTETLIAALRAMDKRESPMANIHPVIVRDNRFAAVDSEQD